MTDDTDGGRAADDAGGGSPPDETAATAGPDDPTRRNRLDEEASPYLQQHADNPVNWQPWDEAALAAARERDVPIFLSIGYSACHWCHVMAEESFEDPEVAAVLNEHFVPVKVDREERPAVDDVYMTACQLTTGRGGWPLSAFLTPEGDPFWLGTYLPREARGDQTGFLDLAEQLAEAWETDREGVEQRAGQIASAVAGELESVPDTDPTAGEDDALCTVADAAVDAADPDHGGFGTGQKFPQPRRVRLLLRAADRTGDDRYRNVAVDALDAMANGGLFDHVGGGFHRYCTDRTWTVPHFEKMLYDNAELAVAFLAGYRVTGERRFAEVARRTLGFLERELAHPDGGFYSTLDARSAPPDDSAADPAEGAFYVWTPDQVRAVLDDDLAALACDRWGITAAGNVEGATVLTRAATVGDLAADRDADPETVAGRVRTAREELFAARATRPRPARDEKVIAGWNGLAVSALAEAALTLDAAFADRAAAALSFVRESLWDGESLTRRVLDGDRKGAAVLADYAYLARGAVDCYGVTGDLGHLAFAAALADAILDRFYDAGDGALYATPVDGEGLLARPRDTADQSTPSPVGVAAEALLALDAVLDRDRYGDAADAVIEGHAGAVAEQPIQHPTLAAAADTRDAGHLELTIVGDMPDAWRRRVGERYLPDRLLAPRPPALDDWLAALDLDAAPPIWAGRDADAPVAYVCRQACSPPLSDADAVDEWIDRLGPGGEGRAADADADLDDVTDLGDG